MTHTISKRVLVIQDISAIGRVSMMTALPILASAGHNVSCLPTALLSTHSGEFIDFSFHDLTQDMFDITNHWKTLPLAFDGIQTGYLGSHKQVEAVLEALSLVKDQGVIVVDPVMGDNGKLYSKITQEMVLAMEKLCQKATVILPNLTEAAFLLGQNYENRFDEPEYVLQIAKALYQKLGVPYVILTGVSTEPDLYGAFAYDCKKDQGEFFQQPKIEDHFYGTGDLFTCVFTAAYLRGKTVFESAEIATECTQRTIKSTKALGLERRFGVNFEQQIPWLIQRLGLLDNE